MQPPFRSRFPRFAFLLALALLLGACQDSPERTTAPIAVRAAEAGYGEINNSMLFSGRTQATVDLVVTSMLPGRVENLLVQLGERVEAGQPLLQLEGDDVHVNVAQVKAARDMAQANYQIVSGGSARTQLLQADAELSAAQWAYDETERVYLNMLESRGDSTPAQLLQLDSNVQLTHIAYEDAARQYEKMLRADSDASVSPDLLQIGSNREVARMAYAEVERNYMNLLSLHRLGAVSDDQLKSLQLQLDTSREQMDAAQRGYDTAVSELQRGAKLQLQAAEEQWLAASQGQSSAGTDALSLSRIQLDSARLQLSTVQEVYALTVQQLLPESIAAAAAQLSQAQAAYDQILLQQSRLLVTAPVGGVVTYIGCDPQEMIDTSSLLFMIADPAQMRVDLAVSERDAKRLQGRSEAEIVLDAEALPAAILYVGTSPDPRSGLYPVRLSFSNPENRYLIGQSCDVRMITELKEDVLIVPRSAVFAQNERSYVYVLAEEQARLVAVETGSQDKNHIEITAGLEPGQVVATSAQSRLSDGAPVLAVAETR